ncbi:DUF4214 domain-containing protein [Cellulomonas sp. McL0617]|uniref:DUF4214 domain-containing protein n=1 Tax=Cellulomonas sp. McL0617 TaxID=3415675 RepID=UPI003CFAA7DE
MSSRRPSRVRVRGWAGVLALLLVGGLAAPSAAAPVPAVGPVLAVAGDSITFSGHGWGHGRGMGQYGALGYAVTYKWGYTQILDHYYGGTTLAGIGNPYMNVELTAETGTTLTAVGTNVQVNGAAVGTGDVAIRAQLQPGGAVALWSGASCGTTTWTPIAGAWTAGNVTIGTADPSTVDGMIRVCEASGERTYRGQLTVQNVSGTQMTFNRLGAEDYLRGVVPRESPASWGNLANGMEALKAQAVAARSYALSSTRASGANTCDTTACQVYSGAAFRPTGGARTLLEAAQSDLAVLQTAGQVRKVTGTSTIARTEFSSSTGGWTAGGTFPAVVDDGDAVAQNPYHDWVSTIPVATVASGLGVSSVRSISVTQRNGLGADGGRVLSVNVVDNNGAAKTLTGNQVRIALGLRSDWFSISWISPAEAQSVVKALYTDLLGRGPDATGLTGWTAALLSGTSQSALVTALTHSDEYIALRVTKAYNEVLGRGPDPVGAQAWLTQIRAGLGTVDDVQRRFYDSDEYFATSGGTWPGYVQRLYTTMLHRGASDAEVSTWVSLVATQGRAWVVDSIWWSREAASIRAGSYYQTFLGRGPDPTGLASWTTVLLTSGEGAVRAGIAGSQEYRARAIARFP